MFDVINPKDDAYILHDGKKHVHNVIALERKENKIIEIYKLDKDKN